jgi:tetratricopeptide (TPR) repeat protein
MPRALALVSLLLILPDARADDLHARALRKGRKLEAKGDHLGALKAYDEALAAEPNDPALLSEVSVSALAAGDLARARDAATRAARSDASPRLQAAAYFNLGQIEEKATDVDKAVAAYRSAMEACPSTAARGRLAKLAPKIANEINSIEATRPQGPYETLAKATAAQRCEPQDDPESPKLRAPFLAVRNLDCKARSPGDEKEPGSLGLALQLGSGWYVVPDAKEVDVAASENRGSFDLTHDWPGFGPVLEWHGNAHHHHVSHSSTAAEIESYSHTTLVACVVDRGGKPFCLSPFEVDGSEYQKTNYEDGRSEDAKDVQWSMDVKYVDGAVEISIFGAAECALLPGRHPIQLDRTAGAP